jgi:hypothetical protein
MHWHVRTLCVSTLMLTAVVGSLIAACDPGAATREHERECPRGTVAVDAGSYAGGTALSGGFLAVGDPSGVAAYRNEPGAAPFQCAYVCIPGSHPQFLVDHLICTLDQPTGAAK